MAEIEARFDRDWDTCQKTPLRDGGQICENALKESDLEDHCHIFTRGSDAFRMQTCSRFGQDVHRMYENCNLNELDDNSYRYGWLEDFRSLRGKVLANVDTGLGNVVSVVYDAIHGGVFLAAFDNNSTLLFRVPWKSEHSTLKTRILWRRRIRSYSRFPMCISRSGDELFILDSPLDFFDQSQSSVLFGEYRILQRAMQCYCSSSGGILPSFR